MSGKGEMVRRGDGWGGDRSKLAGVAFLIVFLCVLCVGSGLLFYFTTTVVPTRKFVCEDGPQRMVFYGVASTLIGAYLGEIPVLYVSELRRASPIGNLLGALASLGASCTIIIHHTLSFDCSITLGLSYWLPASLVLGIALVLSILRLPLCGILSDAEEEAFAKAQETLTSRTQSDLSGGLRSSSTPPLTPEPHQNPPLRSRTKGWAKWTKRVARAAPKRVQVYWGLGATISICTAFSILFFVYRWKDGVAAFVLCDALADEWSTLGLSTSASLFAITVTSQTRHALKQTSMFDITLGLSTGGLLFMIGWTWAPSGYCNGFLLHLSGAWLFATSLACLIQLSVLGLISEIKSWPRRSIQRSIFGDQTYRQTADSGQRELGETTPLIPIL